MDTSRDSDLAAGDFSTWLAGMQTALSETSGSDVPCGGCTACCTSSQFVHIGPDETDTLAHIPRQLLFPAPHLPSGHQLLGYDERGHCPMLVDNRCSIYDHRPRTCRTYDCRVFPASGVDVDDDKPAIARQTERWRFGLATPADRERQTAVRSAARFLVEHPEVVPGEGALVNATERAVLAIEIHSVFLAPDPANGTTAIVDPDVDAVRAEIARHTRRR